ncbi:MAG: outer membrane lipoprotein-sorting protein [Puniceicoccales bacterium]
MLKLFFASAATFITCAAMAMPDDFKYLTGPELIERYAETQTVDSELAFIELKVFESATPGKDVVKRRFLALTRKDDAGFDYLIRLIRPQEVEGVSVLTDVGANDKVTQYLYLPASGKPVKLAGEGRTGHFLGSDFAYEDLIREAPGNFFYERMPDGEAQGEECAVVRATPKNNVPSGYQYRDIYLDPTSFEIRKVIFYGENGKPTKEMQAYEYRSPDIDGTTVRPRFAVMKNQETGTISVFKVLKSRLDLSLDDKLFDAEQMAAISPTDVNGLLTEIDVVTVEQ